MYWLETCDNSRSCYQNRTWCVCRLHELRAYDDSEQRDQHRRRCVWGLLWFTGDYCCLRYGTDKGWFWRPGGFGDDYAARLWCQRFLPERHHPLSAGRGSRWRRYIRDFQRRSAVLVRRQGEQRWIQSERCPHSGYLRQWGRCLRLWRQQGRRLERLDTHWKC